MKQLFDYIFFRVYSYYKNKKDPVPETKGALLLSLIQFFTLLDIMTVVQLFHSFKNPHKYYALIVLLLLGFVNWYIYERNFDEEKYKKWKDENITQKIRRGWLIVMYLIGSFLFPVVYGILRHNFRLI